MAKSNRVRIIGGEFRRRLIAFPNTQGLRPTPDRLRETVFNWLQPWLVNSRCLDLYAGSGALGFEALSRGASHATFIDANEKVIKQLKATRDLLSVTARTTIIQQPAKRFIRDFVSTQYDIIFLDPPFDDLTQQQIYYLLEREQCLAPGGVIYIEARQSKKALPLPENWRIIRNSRCGDSSASLIETGEY